MTRVIEVHQCPYCDQWGYFGKRLRCDGCGRAVHFCEELKTPMYFDIHLFAQWWLNEAPVSTTVGEFFRIDDRYLEQRTNTEIRDDD